jgi:hypothetical protein
VSNELLASSVLDDDELRQRQERFTLGATLSLDDLASVQAPRLLDALREAEPVSWIPELGGWLVSDHEHAREILAPRADVSVQSMQNMVRASLGRMMLTVDATQHDRLRQPFEVHFDLAKSKCAFVSRYLRSAGTCSNR